MGRSGTALLVAVCLSAAAYAAPERPCPACGHGMARALGQVAGAADYACRFCEVAIRVRPDGRELVSYRIAGERREFDLLGGERLSFPLPGEKAPEDVIVPVSEAALAAAPGAGHPVKLPGHPVNLPGHPVPVPTGAPVNLPGEPIGLPAHPVELPAQPVGLPSAPVEPSDHPVKRPGFSVTIQRHPVKPAGAPVRLGGHPVGRPGHPIAMGGTVVVLSRAAESAPEATETREPAPVVVVMEAEQPGSRFFGRPSMPSVLRGVR